MSLYQAPERYVWDFVEDFLRELEIEEEVFREVRVRGLKFKADFGVGSIVIEAEAPGGIEKGRGQIVEYINRYGFAAGLLLDIPTERYYVEYPNPYTGRVGFEVYVKTASGVQLAYAKSFERSMISEAKKELKLLLEVLKGVAISRSEPRVDTVLNRVQMLVNRYVVDIENLLKNTQVPRVQIYFDMWKKNMGLIYGQNVVEKLGDKLTTLFARLTVYVTFLKALGITLIESLQGMGRYNTPYLLATQGSQISRFLWDRGGNSIIGVIFERDEYDWVFDENISAKLDSFLKDLGKVLLEFDWSRPVSVDLLKRVYQHIVPREIRRILGEFYTPDWLAKLILYRALHILVKGSPPPSPLVEDIDGEIVRLIDEFYRKRGTIPSFVDPTCGSFTFGVQYLNALVKWYYGSKPSMHPLDFAKNILNNVVGIDLNPVAVITAKVNYLLQVYRLLTVWGEERIYFVDMPTIPVLRTDLTLLYEIGAGVRDASRRSLLYYVQGDQVVIKIPIEVFANADLKSIFEKCKVRYAELTIKKNESKRSSVYYIEFSLPRKPLVSLDITKLYRVFIALTRSVADAENELATKLDERYRDAFARISESIKCLEDSGVNSYLMSIIMNAFILAYLVNKRFNIVVGNLPWVNVSSFPEDYRERIKLITEKLDIKPPKEVARKVDISALLFVLACEYLVSSEEGVVALMVPASLFRGLHGAVWREYIMRRLILHEIWDLEDVKPFEDAENQPGIVFAQVGRKKG